MLGCVRARSRRPVRPAALVCTATLLLCCSWAASPAGAHAAPASGWTVSSLAEPTNFSTADTFSSPGYERCLAEPGATAPAQGGVCDRYVVSVTNASTVPLPGPITIADTLPSSQLVVANVEARTLETQADETVEGEGFKCSPATVSCTYEDTMAPGDMVQMVVRVYVKEGAPPQAVQNHASVEHEGAVVAVTSPPTTAANSIDGPTPAFGLQAFSFQPHGPAGAPDTLAGDHPAGVTAAFDLNTVPSLQSSEEDSYEPVQELKDAVIDLPPGVAADPLAASRCPESSLLNNESGYAASNCPATALLGDVGLDLQGYAHSSIERVGGRAVLLTGLYDMVPDGGYPAQFGFDLVGFYPVYMYGQVVPSPAGYHERVLVPGVLRGGVGAAVTGVSLSFYGDPGEHDGAGSQALFANPTACSGGPLTATIYLDSWQHPGEWIEDGRILHGPNGPSSEPLLSSPGWVKAESVVYPEITECDALQFNPLVSVQPTTTQADEPAGYGVSIEMPQAPQVWPDRATPDLRDATVTFPPGVSISPAGADGLSGCSESLFDLSSSEPAACPQASQIGTATITTPLLESPLAGEIFLRTPECEGSACQAGAEEGKMFGLFLQAQGSGVNIKLKGDVEVGTGSARSLASGLAPGQLRAVFKEDPQLPLSDLHLQFDSGGHAPLANPQSCGTATTSFQLTPWSVEVPEERASSFQVDWDGEGGACPATQPFNPSFTAGLSYTNAGQFSPFTLTFARSDRQQDLSSVTIRTPDGVGAMLAGAPRCEEPQASQGTCPAASEIGSSTIAIGAGGQPYWLPQPGQPENPVFLTGPYGGDPFGLAILVHANAGPFDLGNLVVRAGISIDPQTSALTIATGPLLQILDGIPLRMRTVSVDIDRTSFMFAPTNCAKQQVTATITSAEGTSAPVSSPFDVGGCQDLPFKPKLSASTAGSGSFAGHGASLNVRITAPAEGASASSPEANLKSVHVELPPSLPTRLSTLQHACTAAQFASSPASCPPSSIVGSATIHTPTLPVSLRGPAYLVSHGGAAFPDLVLVLQGDGVTIQLTGKTEIKKRVTYTHFEDLPDSPISSFELDLPEGPHSVLSATAKLCAPTKTVTVTRHVTARSHGHTRHLTIKIKEKIPSPLSMPTRIEGQNNAVLSQTTQVAITGCPKPKPTKGTSTSS